MTELLSIAFMSCNRVARIEESLGSVLAQTLDDVEVVIADDGSIDGTYEKLRQIVAQYRGNKRLRLLRNEQRLGVIGNFNRIMSETQSDYVMFAHDDDVSLPKRASTILAAIESAAIPPGAVFNDAFSLIGHDRAVKVTQVWPAGTMITPEEVARLGTNIVGAVATYSRRVYSEFGPVPIKAHFEDACCLFRATLLGGVIHLNEPLVVKRVDKNSLTGATSILIASSGSEVRQAITKHIRDLLPTASVWAKDLSEYAPQLKGGSMRADLIHRLLQKMDKRVKAELDLLERRPSALKYWVTAFLMKEISLRDLVKLLLSAYWPELWRRYLRWRYRRINKASYDG